MDCNATTKIALVLYALVAWCSAAPAQESSLTAEAPFESANAAIRIIVEPMIYHPIDWKAGGRVTVGVIVESADSSRTIGIATNVELVALKTHKNRYEMMLRSSKEKVSLLRAAAGISEYWFMVTPFKEEHRDLVRREPSFKKFLTENTEFRPSDGSNWGLNSRSKERLPKPKKEELPLRPEKAEQSLDAKPTN